MTSSGKAALIGGVISIRPMEPRDREAVAALLLDLNRVENALTGDRHVTPGAGHDCLAENEPYIAEQGGAMLVAEAGRRVVGTLLMSFEEEDAFVRPDLRNSAHVLDLCVDEGFRGRGIGRLLLAEAERIAREAGRSALLIGAIAGNERAIGLYESAGFRRQAVEMLKPLRPF
jgi:ribosomal protein S18 acetylase RimI-like enzyme